MFNLPGIVEVNYLGLTPGSQGHLRINSLYYKDASGNLNTLEVAENKLLQTDLSGPVSFTFQTVYAGAIVVVMEQPTYQQATAGATNYTGQGSFIIKTTQVSLVDIFKLQTDPNQSSNFLNIAKDIIPLSQEGLPSLPPAPVVQSGSLPAAPNTNFSMVKYSFGLSGVQISNHKYMETGVYVSKTNSVPLLTSMALQTTEYLPLQNISILGKEAYIEYWVYKEDYDDNGLIGSQYFPILPSDATTIELERIFPDSSGICSLRFNAICPITPGLNDIQVYRNGLPLSSTDWSLQTTMTDNYTKIKLDVLPGIIQGLTDIFTCSYIPAHLYSLNKTDVDNNLPNWLFDNQTNDTKDFYINPEHTIWYRQDGIVEATPYGPNFTATYSDVTIIVLMRTVVHNADRTALLDNYKLFLGGVSAANS